MGEKRQPLLLHRKGDHARGKRWERIVKRPYQKSASNEVGGGQKRILQKKGCFILTEKRGGTLNKRITRGETGCNVLKIQGQMASYVPGPLERGGGKERLDDGRKGRDSTFLDIL